jgi:hypothetical protein
VSDRLRSIDKLRLLEELSLNSEWQATVADYRDMHLGSVLHGKTADDREAARQRWHAVSDLLKFIEDRKASYRVEFQREQSEGQGGPE